MITGIVSPAREPVIQVVIRDGAGNAHSHDAIVDTGYTGWFTLAPAVIAALGLPWRERGGAILADGSRTLFDVHEATVLWDGLAIVIPVDEIDADPLVGMSLVYGYELVLPIVDGATFTLSKIATP